MQSFFIHVSTGTDYDRATYDAAAGRLTGVVVNVLSHSKAIDDLTGNVTRAACHADIEVSLEDHELTVKAVVDIESESKVKFDKGKFTRMLKEQDAAIEWPKLKVAKRAVPSDAGGGVASAVKTELLSEVDGVATLEAVAG